MMKINRILKMGIVTFLMLTVLWSSSLTGMAANESTGDTYQIHAQAAYAGTLPVVDGEIDEIWNTTQAMYTNENWQEGNARGYAKILWTESTLYFVAKVEDPTLETSASDTAANGVHFWVSETVSLEKGYHIIGDWHCFVNANGNMDYFVGTGDVLEAATCAAQSGEGYYIVELAVPAMSEGRTYSLGDGIGFNVSVDDDMNDDYVRDTFSSWQKYGDEVCYWENAGDLNKVQFVNEVENLEATETAGPEKEEPLKEEEPKDSGVHPVIILIIAVGVLAIAAIVGYVVYRKKKKILSVFVPILLVLVTLASNSFMSEAVDSDRVEVQSDGTVILQNDVSGKKNVKYVFHKSVKAGEMIYLDVDVKPAQKVSVWVLGCDVSVKWDKEWYAMAYDEWTGKTQISLTAEENIEEFSVIVGYNDTTQDFKNNVVTISNVRIGNDIARVDGNGTVTLQNKVSGNKSVKHLFQKSVKAGDTISFDLDVKPAQKVSVWVLGCDVFVTWDNEWYAKSYTSWEGKTQILVTAEKSIEKFSVMVGYNDTAQNFKNNVVTIANVKVTEPQVDVTSTGVILRNDINENRYLEYTFDKNVKAGRTVALDVNVTPAQNISIRLYGEDGLAGEYYARFFRNEDSIEDIVSTFTEDTKNITVRVTFHDVSRDFSENEVKISNVKVGKK